MRYGLNNHWKRKLLLCLVFAAFSDVYSKENLAVKTYTMGVVPQFDARTIYTIWQPILDQIEERGDIRLILQGTRSIGEFETKIRAGKFDFAYMNPYHLLIANRSQGYIPIIRDHAKSLSGILVVSKDSKILSPDQLNNKTVAFPSPNSLGATMMIRSDLKDKFKATVTPKYVLSHSSVYLNVAMGFSVAGGGVLRTLEKQPAELRQKLRILHQTKAVTAHPISVHPRVPSIIKDQVYNILLSLSKTVGGKSLFKRIPMSKAGIAHLEDYQTISDMNLERFSKEEE